VPWIWITILIFGVPNIMEGSPRAVAMPFLVKEDLGANVAMFFYGVSFNIFALVWTNTLQEMVPNDKLGRVYAFDSLESWVLLLVGFALADWGTDLLGAPTVFLIGGCGTILMTLIGLAHPAVRNLD
jgi:hypothetical protein